MFRQKVCKTKSLDPEMVAVFPLTSVEPLRSHLPLKLSLQEAESPPKGNIGNISSNCSPARTAGKCLNICSAGSGVTPGTGDGPAAEGLEQHRIGPSTLRLGFSPAHGPGCLHSLEEILHWGKSGDTECVHLPGVSSLSPLEYGQLSSGHTNTSKKDVTQRS
ncbi:hypothetical protein P7K49_016202 [Saguinus oedipus]|uniref:Uncharacterized protein n=1 Tax=Saguinus oedipus TaxID=9490 RepID=A0ABQ9VDD6_SAGOE|nr:hypothetical protein P7K49_016202 [Saguinus oedipus]